MTIHLVVRPAPIEHGEIWVWPVSVPILTPSEEAAS